ncbi:hypothetical protein [Yeguia hominis]|uniref:X-X-X-Leu-X-X-Gly heptad repeats n=1 Tax=Yeguia hominis TaxID=2763662 RepID=A0A926DAB9_9FIRM|nr:hypothetical protein [Yeguia hominis]MBC8534773.1 hypothetical protein [Yeguia hominis]
MLFERFKKLSAKKMVAVLLTLVMISGMMGAGVYALSSNTAKTPEEETAASSSSQNQETAAGTSEAGTAGKTETVYVMTGADGKVSNVIVSDWLSNPTAENQITDYTELTDVTNVKGDETYTVDAKGNYVWNAGGNDIYYQGKTDKELPVAVDIEYKLDGKKISPKDLAGKSGNVTMRLNYTNKEKKTVTINGKKETIYVPFIMVSGIILDNDIFSNVEVTNGKFINDGDRSIVMGMAMPGMQESLGIDQKDLELPDYVEITADVKDFSLSTVMTVATNDVFSSLDGNSINEKELKDTAKKLTDAMDQLLDGVSALYSGTSELRSKSGDLVDGVDALTAGAWDLRNGAGTLYAGTKDLEEGANELSDGLGTLSSKSGELNDGAKQVFTSLLAAADSQLAAAGLTLPSLTVDNYDEVLSGAIASLDETAVYNMAYNTALSKVTAAVDASEADIRTGVESAVRKAVLEAVLKQVGQEMTAEDYEKAVAAGLIPEETQTAIEQAVSAQMASSKIQAKIEQNVAAQKSAIIDQRMASDEVVSQINAAVEQAKTGANSIAALKNQLDSYAEFYSGVLAYTGGVDKAYDGVNGGDKSLVSGTKALKDGASALYNGTDTLYSGLGSLQSGSGALVDGVAALDDGAKALSDGLKEFQSEGIQKILDFFDDNIDVLAERLQAIVEVSQEYQNFAGISADMDGSVKFIFRTEAIGE